MLDSHCHLTYPQLASQIDAVLARAAEAGVVRMVTIGTSLDDAQRALALCQRHPHIRCAAGIHPHHAAEASEGWVQALRRIHEDPCVLAVGEMGLDYHYDFAPRDRQRQVFMQQLELARELGKPVIIHCREATDECLAVLADFPDIPAVFHCFTGSLDEARRVLDRGYLIGLTGVVTFKRSEELREVAAFVPAERLLVETDAPYLSPEPMRRQKVNEPALVVHTARALAVVRKQALEDIDRLTTDNALRFFRWR